MSILEDFPRPIYSSRLGFDDSLISPLGWKLGFLGHKGKLSLLTILPSLAFLALQPLLSPYSFMSEDAFLNTESKRE